MTTNSFFSSPRSLLRSTVSSLYNRLVGRWQTFWIGRCTGTSKGSYSSDLANADATTAKCSREMPEWAPGWAARVHAAACQCIKPCEFSCSAQKWLVHVGLSCPNASHCKEAVVQKGDIVLKKSCLIVSILSALNGVTYRTKRNYFRLETIFQVFLRSSYAFAYSFWECFLQLSPLLFLNFHWTGLCSSLLLTINYLFNG